MQPPPLEQVSPLLSKHTPVLQEPLAHAASAQQVLLTQLPVVQSVPAEQAAPLANWGTQLLLPSQ